MKGNKGMSEKYDFEIPEEGLEYDILDTSFNATTKQFILNAGIKPGMKVLDVGSGAGVMTAWLAEQVGSQGMVTAVDNSPEQLNALKKRMKQAGISNVQTKNISAYDISGLKETFDLIYCRFVLHHLHSPRKAIKIFYDNLKPGGLYIGEEGLCNMAFSYPPTFAWEGYEPAIKSPAQETDGVDRDGDFGMKLFYTCRQTDFDILDCKIIQPVLWKKEQKLLLLENLNAYKKTELEQGGNIESWQAKYDETLRAAQDDNQIFAFYGSCQVAAQKKNS